MKEKQTKSQNIIPSIGIKMKEVRKKHKMTLKDIGEILEVNQQQIRKYETLKSEVPFKALWLFTAYFEISAEEFFPKKELLNKRDATVCYE